MEYTELNAITINGVVRIVKSGTINGKQLSRLLLNTDYTMTDVITGESRSETLVSSVIAPTDIELHIGDIIRINGRLRNADYRTRIGNYYCNYEIYASKVELLKKATANNDRI